jgi:tRNA(His) 5'-end guanylyltransferase
MRAESLGERIKRYEAASANTLIPRTPVMIRVDGRAFHTFTRHCERPFDRHVIDSMIAATRYAAADMTGFRLAYVQSDEATFLIDDLASLQSQPWFGNKAQKLVSLSASLFTAAFNQAWPGDELAAFDARAFSIPRDDAPNAFVWRQRDWERNSLQMLARAHFPHEALAGRKCPEVHEMLHGVGVNWAHLDPQLKNGTFVLPGGDLRFERADYGVIDRWISQATAEETETVT